MVNLWVYAGGGYAEVNGLLPFLMQRLPKFNVQRRTPALRRPGPRPPTGKEAHPPAKQYQGNTGTDLIKEVKEDIINHWDKTANLVLLLDDTDCDIQTEKRIGDLEAVVTDTLIKKHGYTEETLPKIVVGLAAPELEAWILADWESTFKSKFGQCHSGLRYCLSSKHRITLEAPETFDCKDNEGKYKKISVCIIEAVQECCKTTFSKNTDTARLLLSAKPDEIGKRCPHFRRFWVVLENYKG